MWEQVKISNENNKKNQKRENENKKSMNNKDVETS